MTKRIRVAAAQMNCINGDIAVNLAHAGEFAQRAAAAGANLILFPEFMPSGYEQSTRL